MYDNQKNYSTNCVRALVPALTSALAPYVVTAQEQNDTLEYIEFFTEAGAPIANAGVKVYNRDLLIYPAPGGDIDPAWVAVGSFGVLSLSAYPLRVPFGRKMRGSPFDLRFEFCKDSAGALSVGVLIVTSNSKQKTVGELRQDAKPEK
jgi:hypothetical protein